MSNGFTCCGLAPLSAEAINYEKLLNTNRTTQHENINQEGSTTENKEYKCTLKFIENSVDMDTLQLFMIAENRDEEWHGEEKYRELFTIWLKCRRLVKYNSTPMNIENDSSISKISSVKLLKEFYFNI